MKFVIGGVAVLALMVLSVDTRVQAQKDKPKHTIKEVMAEAHKSGLWKKIAAGTAEKEDREKLAALYKSLTENTPPQGELADWKKTTAVLHKIAVDAIKDPEAGKKLKVNCGACHKKFK
jgi:hypothetical protein